MKYLSLFIFSIILATSVQSQSQQGKVVYHSAVTHKFDDSKFEQMTEERRNQIKERMKKWGQEKKVLVFTPSESLYRNFSAEKDALDNSEWEEPQGGHWRMMKPQSSTYRSIENNKNVAQKNFMDKKFLIKDELLKPKWKLTGKQEEIIGYACQQATYQKDDTTLITVWFSPQIPVSTGPEEYGNLPGLILKFNKNDGEQVIVAESIRFYEPKEDEITEPKKGKEVTQEEYEDIVKKKMQEMREMYGGGKGGMHH